MLSRVWRGLLVVAVLVSALVFVAAADATVINSAGGNAFSGTYTNDTGATIDEIGILTADTNGNPNGQKNPITSLTFDGWKCTPDTYIQTTGEYYCQDARQNANTGSGPPLAAGATATFSGTTKNAVTQGEGFKFCTFNGPTHCEIVKVPGGSTETIKFAVKEHSHRLEEGGHGFLLTNMKGLGSVVVPTPNGEIVSSKRASGAIQFSQALFSDKDVLILDEYKLTLRITKARFRPEGAQGYPSNPLTLFLTGVVAKTTADPKSCPKGSKARITLVDGTPTHAPDGGRIEVCGIHENFVSGTNHSTVAVAIQEQRPKPPS